MRNKAYPWNKVTQINSLKHMIELRVNETPDETAFVIIKKRGDTEKISCKQFYDDVNSFGTWLFINDIHNEKIAIIGENSYEWILSFFAVVNSGNVVVPIDKSLSNDKISELVNHSECKIVIISDEYIDVVDELDDITIIRMSSLREKINEGFNRINEGVREYIDYYVNINDVSVLAYTSGTTGSSRGVMLSQKNIIADVNNGCQNFNPSGNALAVLPLHHMFGLVVGMIMVFHYRCPIYINNSLKNIKRDLEIAKPQTMFFVPLFVETLYRNVWETADKSKQSKKLRIGMKLSDFLLKIGVDIRKKLFKSIISAFGGNLEYILCGGAPLDEKYILEFRSWGIEILNAYGVTECSPGVAVNRNFHHKDGSVGLPIPNCKVKISESGEIIVKGDNVMIGYFKDECATAEAIKDGWYHTGDLGRIDNEGFLYITGRKKNLIILSNGENVSPEELEILISRDDGVFEVVVYAENNLIVAEIFPTENYLNNKEYFDKAISEINRTLPSYKRINNIRLREVEFEKNTTKKILRYKINGGK